jgi:alpha/beta superfamily hydrolase
MPALTLTGPAGPLEAILEEPAADRSGAPRAAVVFAHPLPTHGGTMHTKVVYQSAKALARIGCAALRFNFRGVGTSAGTFDEGLGERDDFGAALDYMADRYPGVPLWATGFSFGGWVALDVGAADPRVTLLLAIAPPLEGRGYDFSRVLSCEKPKFFIQGERDDIAPLDAMYRFYAKLLEPKELVVIDGADHLFDGKTTEVGDAIEDLLADFGA